MLTGSQGSTVSCYAVRSSAALTGWPADGISYAIDMQRAGQDKRDTVACEVVHHIKVAKDRGQDRTEGRVHLPKKIKI